MPYRIKPVHKHRSVISLVGIHPETISEAFTEYESLRYKVPEVQLSRALKKKTSFHHHRCVMLYTLNSYNAAYQLYLIKARKTIVNLKKENPWQALRNSHERSASTRTSLCKGVRRRRLWKHSWVEILT